jgi:hypothetical protein
VDLKGKRAVFAGCARDCDRHLGDVLRNVSRLSDLYGGAAFVFTENDSTDGTRETLRAWIDGRADGRLVTLDGLSGTISKRTERIAHARNAYMDVVLSEYAAFDHLVVFDMDDVNARAIDVDGFERAATHLESGVRIAAAFANQRGVYYDISALRHPTWCPTDCWAEVDRRPQWLPWATAVVWYLHRRQITIPATARPIHVQSAFGGLAIYKIAALGGCRYAGSTAEGSAICEHVPLHADIAARGGQLVIAPTLQNDAPSEHVFDATRFSVANALLMRALRTAQTLSPPWKALEGHR